MKEDTTIAHSNMTNQARLENLEKEVELLKRMLRPLFGSKRRSKTSKQQQLIAKSLEKLIQKHKPKL